MGPTVACRLAGSGAGSRACILLGDCHHLAGLGSTDSSTSRRWYQLTHALSLLQPSARLPPEQMAAPAFRRGGSGGFREGRRQGPLQGGPERLRGSSCVVRLLTRVLHPFPQPRHPACSGRCLHEHPVGCVRVDSRRRQLCLRPSASASVSRRRPAPPLSPSRCVIHVAPRRYHVHIASYLLTREHLWARRRAGGPHLRVRRVPPSQSVRAAGKKRP